jgi:hypothetical protein
MPLLIYLLANQRSACFANPIGDEWTAGGPMSARFICRVIVNEHSVPNIIFLLMRVTLLSKLGWSVPYLFPRHSSTVSIVFRRYSEAISPLLYLILPVLVHLPLRESSRISMLGYNLYSPTRYILTLKSMTIDHSSIEQFPVPFSFTSYNMSCYLSAYCYSSLSNRKFHSL